MTAGNIKAKAEHDTLAVCIRDLHVAATTIEEDLSVEERKGRFSNILIGADKDKANTAETRAHER